MQVLGFERLIMALLMLGLIAVMGFILWDTIRRRNSGRLAASILLATLGLGALGFVVIPAQLERSTEESPPGLWPADQARENIAHNADERGEEAVPYDVVIVGGGVSGTALLYQLTRYTDVARVALLEKYDRLAQVNSRSSNNSQTIHCGDIETNYSLEKALRVKRAAAMLVNYGLGLPAEERDEILFKFPKMVLGVGARECAFLRQRYETFREHYSGMRLLEKAQIAEVEPLVVAGREGEQDEELVALAVVDEYTAANYQKLSDSFVRQAQKSGRAPAIHMGTKVAKIEKEENGLYRVRTNRGDFRTRSLVVSAGGHSLLFAQQMGHGLNFSCLPVAGSFYFVPEVLRGKVYTVQNDKLPFAAIHGDPDVSVPGKTRFGPTALLLPMLERYNNSTIGDFFQVLHLDSSVAAVLWDLMRVPDIRNYIFKNFMFEMPLIQRRLFLRDARKIVPGLQLEDITFAKGFGGIRPQLIDREKKKLLLGEARIAPGNGLIFNMTPSPGGTSCLRNAEKDMRELVTWLGASFDQEAFHKDFYQERQQSL
ncbi:MAG: FAD-dependent oxidoreductase [Kistimonas sp.]|nr:FAD-dependent oxidoreductase [Kistimonas sp.]